MLKTVFFFCRLDSEFYRIIKKGNLKQINADPSKPKAKYQWVQYEDSKRKRRQANDDQIMMFNCDVSIMYNIRRKFLYLCIKKYFFEKYHIRNHSESITCMVEMWTKTTKTCTPTGSWSPLRFLSQILYPCACTVDKCIFMILSFIKEKDNMIA